MSDSFPKPLSEKEEEIYLAQYLAGDAESKNILIERNLRLVAHIAKKYSSTNCSLDDLISIGTIGLIKAVNTYSSSRSVRLATYASKCVENEILMFLRSSKKTRSDVSLNEPLGTDKEGNEISFNDILGTDPDVVLNDISLKLQIKNLYELIEKKLTKREKSVIVNRYGLYDKEAKTQREVAVILGISRSYVSRIEKKALEKLREDVNNI